MRTAFVSLILAFFYLSLLPDPTRSLAVFPGAVGHGTNTAAGRYGQVIRVTNLNDSGAGSFRAAVTASGARIVIFEVSGNISLGSRVEIHNPYLMIAGQTAPSPGVTLRERDVQIATHDVLVQHVRFRPGPGPDPFPAEPIDGLQILSETQPDSVYNVVVDHCSISWALDESMDIGSNTHDVTVSNCLLAQALRRSVIGPGAACYGPLVYGSNMTFYRNVFAHTGSRNPKFVDETTGAFVNNIVYNATNSPDVQPSTPSATEPILLNFEGNVFKLGQFTGSFSTHALIIQYQGSETSWNEGSQIWINDSRCITCTSGGDWDDAVIITGNPPAQFITDLRASARINSVWPSGLTPIAASAVMNSVLPDVGALPHDRDTLDDFVVSSVDDSTGTLIDCVESGEIIIDSGNVVSSSGSNLVVTGAAGGPSLYCYVTYTIRVTNGGTPQVRTVTAFDPNNPGGGSKTLTVNTPWSPVPDNTYTWEVFESCAANGGGWPPLMETVRGLTVPANPNGDADSDGYTNVEEWIHAFPSDGAVVSNFDAYTDSTSGSNEYFKYQYKLRAKWTTDIATTSKLQYRVQGTTPWSETTASGTPTTSHIRVVSGLSAGTTYEARAVAIDNSTGLITYGSIETVSTYGANIGISNLAVSQALGGQGVTVTFTYNTSANTSCRINLRLEQTPPVAWGTNDIAVSNLHGTHSHAIKKLQNSTVYHAYIQVFPQSMWNGEDTVFPDGTVPLSTVTTIYIRITTPNQQGQGGGVEFPLLPLSSGDASFTTSLGHDHPNPFNPSTEIEFELADESPHVTIVIYDIAGRRVRSLVEGSHPAGKHHVTWDGRDDHGSSVASGVYFAKMSVGAKSYVRKMTMLK
jgi:FlgD Ig-like domain